MSVLDRFTLAAAKVGAKMVPAPVWRRVRDAATGVSFEAPFDLQLQATDGPFGTLAEACMTLPFVLDATFLASPNDASPEALTLEMAARWAIDYDLISGAQVQRAVYPGIDEAWVLSAEVRDDAAILGSSWATLRKGGMIACLGLSCWSAEPLGREACHRILGSLWGS